MKKLILLLMVSIVLVMFFDLKSEPLVQHNDNSILLFGKPSIHVGAFCFNDSALNVSWNSIGGAKEYKVYYIPPSGGNWTLLATVPAAHGQKEYSYSFDVTSKGTYLFMVEALNGKGDVKSSGQVQATF